MTLKSTLKAFIDEHPTLFKGALLIVGHSGGPDSTALAHALHALRHDAGFTLHLAHLNHQSRPSASRDEQFVKQMAAQMGVNCTTKKWRLPRQTALSSFEEKARLKRLSFFKSLCRALKTDKVILAHHADDLAETVLMRLIRGTGLRGLRAIQSVTVLDGMTIVRPLLTCSKKDIMQYVRDKKLSFCHDETNQDPRFLRNKIRGGLMPYLERHYNPNIKNTLVNVACNAASDYAALDQYAADALKRMAAHQRGRITFDIRELKNLSESTAQHILHQALLSLKKPAQISPKHVKMLLDLLYRLPSGSRITLPGKITARKDKDQLTIYIS